MARPVPDRNGRDEADKELRQELIQYVLDCLADGEKPQNVRVKLENGGYSEGLVRRLVKKAVDVHQPAAPTSQVNWNMLIGGLICLAGIVGTVGSLILAANDIGSGRAYLFWGAILFGGAQFFRGIAKSKPVDPGR